MTIFLIIGAVVVLLIFWIISIYNNLVKGRNLTEEGWSGIDVQLKRRNDLIPNIVETVKGYATHEKEVFEKVTMYRSQSMGARTVDEQVKADGLLGKAMMNLMAVAENYPELKANQNFAELQKELSTIEDHIQNARRYYNGAARNFNILVESFPSNLIAGMFNFTKFTYYEIEIAEERNAPKVSFN